MTDVEDDADAGTEIDRLRRRVAALEAESQRLRDTHRIELEHEQLRHREHALGLIVEGEAARDRNRLLAKRLGRLRERLEQETKAGRRRERELRAELDAVLGSRTWRAGRALGRSVRPVRGRRT